MSSLSPVTRIIARTSAAAWMLIVTNAARAQMSLPSAPDGSQDPVELGREILSYGLNGISALGAGIAGASLAYAFVKSMAGHQFDGRRVAQVAVGGGGLAGVTFLTNLVLTGTGS